MRKVNLKPVVQNLVARQIETTADIAGLAKTLNSKATLNEDGSFNVKGAKNLSIGDALVINQSEKGFYISKHIKQDEIGISYTASELVEQEKIEPEQEKEKEKEKEVPKTPKK